MLVNGVLNINKPEGITSFQVVASLKKIFKVKKIGHGGTLDPDASGVLPIYLGQATKIAPLLLDTTKEYRAVLHLGIVTDTQDASGNILHRTEGVFFSEEQVLAVLNSFQGEIEQIPPMFSALKHKGKRLYDLARAGLEVERAPRKVMIHKLIMRSFNLPYLTFDTCCSKGTYIRTLCADIGQKLGSGGHMASLQRLRVGDLTIEHSIPYEMVTWEKAQEILNQALYSLDQILYFLPSLEVSQEAERKAVHGTPLLADEVVKYPETFSKGDLLRGYNQQQQLLGIFEALLQSGEQRVHFDIQPSFKLKRLFI